MRLNRDLEGERSALGALPLLAACLAACMAHPGPRERLAEAVHRMNDACRWGRAGTAGDIVQPAYRRHFLARREAWGEDIEMADAEVIEVRFESADGGAIAVVRYNWYRLATMTLHHTTVEQRWRPLGNAYALAGEEVVRGDPDLFTRSRATAAPPGPLGLRWLTMPSRLVAEWRARLMFPSRPPFIEA